MSAATDTLIRMGAREDAWRSSVPEGRHGTWAVERFDVKPGLGTWRLEHEGRPIRPGTYTKLVRNKRIVMSDTPAEMRDAMGFDHQVRRGARSVLIHGLGLGCVLSLALRHPHVEHVDVVELSEDVLALVGPTFTGDPRVRLHHGDALTFRFPAGQRWGVAWHDIWDDICDDNLPQMATLNRRYGRRTDWQGCWSQGLLRSRR